LHNAECDPVHHNGDIESLVVEKAPVLGQKRHVHRRYAKNDPSVGKAITNTENSTQEIAASYSS